ncbi:hypothetical protein EZS27_039705, partial [termite gut metagenome]
VGDLNHKFGNLFSYIERKEIENSVIIVAGDCGIGFDKEDFYTVYLKKLNEDLKEKNVTLLLLRGNHDNPDFFKEERINFSNLKTIPDYSIIEKYEDWDDDKTFQIEYSILCVGGAISVDRMDCIAKDIVNFNSLKLMFQGLSNEELLKMNTKSYFPNETPYFNEQAFDELKEHYKELNLHFVITHTCPSFAPPRDRNSIQHFIIKDEDLVDDLKYERKVMDNIYKRLMDDYHIILEWHYGHFHWFNSEVIKGIHFRLHKDVGYEVDITEINGDYKPYFKE